MKMIVLFVFVGYHVNGFHLRIDGKGIERRRGVVVNEKVEYASRVTEALGRGLPTADDDGIDWNAAKCTGLSPQEMAARIETGLREKEWFVTGNVIPELFADDFKFEDPDVKIDGIRQYAQGVRRLFDQSSRAEIVSCELSPKTNTGTTLTVTWRLSGRVNIGPLGLNIKPYLVYTDLHLRSSDGLVDFQEDRFSIPTWDILLSAFAPWLPFLAPPAPPVTN